MSTPPKRQAGVIGFPSSGLAVAGRSARLNLNGTPPSWGEVAALLRRGFAASLLAVSVACVTEDTMIELRGGAAAVGSSPSDIEVRVEPFVDGRGMSMLGRMRNGYLWPMARFRPGMTDAVPNYFTRTLKQALNGSGIRVIEFGDAPGEFTIRGRVLRLYSDASLMLQTRARIQIDIWSDGRLLDSRTYEGAAQPISFVPASQASGAFESALNELFRDVASDLPQRIRGLPRDRAGERIQ